jgi:hypothetical protein
MTYIMALLIRVHIYYIIGGATELIRQGTLAHEAGIPFWLQLVPLLCLAASLNIKLCSLSLYYGAQTGCYAAMR